MGNAEQNKKLVRDSITRIWAERRYEDVGRFVADDFVDHGAPEGPATGAAAFAQGVRRTLAAFPDAQNKIDELLAEGDRVVTRWTMTGTHTGDGLGFPATGKPVQLSGVTIARIEAGKIAEHWSYRDDVGLFKQLGLMK